MNFSEIRVKLRLVSPTPSKSRELHKEVRERVIRALLRAIVRVGVIVSFGASVLVDALTCVPARPGRSDSIISCGRYRNDAYLNFVP
jgi:hypothetical protein